MKRISFFTAFISLTLASYAQNDSIRSEKLQEVIVQGVKLQQDAPFAITDIGRNQLSGFSLTGQELPFLLARTPGVIAWSENGLGIGTTYMRIRGAADSRINVTLDGVALNSPEDQCVFWANMNGYSSLLGSIQIQRGVGSSTNGDGAFGGNIALQGKAPNPEKSAEVSASFGNMGVMRFAGTASTGLLLDHLIIDGTLNMTSSDGFIHGTSGRSGSYYGGISWLGDRFSVRYRNIGNFEHTGQAWNGVTAGNDDMSLMDGTYGTTTGIRSYKDLYDVGLGRYNSLYETLLTDANGDFVTDADGNYQTVRYTMSDGSLWDKTTDNFQQDHNLLTLSWNINDRLQSTATIHYTYGYGYYEEFRYNNKLKKFGLSDWTDLNSNTVKRSDFVRKKGLEQHTAGLVWNTSYTTGSIDLIGGLSAQQFKGNHFGYLTYVGNTAYSDYLLADGDYKYYDSDASKSDISAFVKADWRLSDNISVFADVQVRNVNYTTDGVNDKFIETPTGYANQILDIDKNYTFLNPKVGFTYMNDGLKLYVLVANSHREPERNNFTDNGSYPAPKAESVIDYEAGAVYTTDSWFVNANIFNMRYKDQFVQTGLISDIGEALTTNISKSYRAGLEISAGTTLTDWLSLEGNATLSDNVIKDFDEVVEDWDAASGYRTIHYDESTLAFSPQVLLNFFADLNVRNWKATWHTAYVSRQYLDNTENKERSLDGFSASDLNIRYSITPRTKVLKEILVGANLNNVFNARYASSGWVYSAICESYGHADDNRYYQIGFIPMAGFNATANITFRF